MLRINIASAIGFDAAGLAKVHEARSILETVFNSPTFKNKVLDFQHEGARGFYFRKNFWGKWLDKRYANQEVYNIIMSAAEQAGNIESSQADLYLNLDPDKGGGTVGYGYPGKKDIYTYSDWFTSFNAVGYACHIAHEWCHKLGFTHSEKKSRLRKYSVPYAIGYMIGDIPMDQDPPL
jgi:hypothetical protein